MAYRFSGPCKGRLKKAIGFSIPLSSTCARTDPMASFEASDRIMKGLLKSGAAKMGALTSAAFKALYAL